MTIRGNRHVSPPSEAEAVRRQHFRDHPECRKKREDASLQTGPHRLHAGLLNTTRAMKENMNVHQTPSMAANFIDTVSEAVDSVANWPGRQPVPEPLYTALGAAVDLACDPLTDALISRSNVSTTDDWDVAERIDIRFPDRSRVTALAAWGQDRIDLYHGEPTNQGGVAIHPWGLAGDRLFINLALGNNADDDSDAIAAASQNGQHVENSLMILVN